MQTKELFAFWKGGATKRMRDDFLMRSIKSRREAAQSATTRASIAFWYQNAACRENPDPNAASGRSVDGQAKAKLETKHRRSHLLCGVGRVVPTGAVLQAAHASVQICTTQTPRPPTVAA